MSLTVRLLEWMLGPLLFFWIISIGTAYLVARASADSAADNHLESVAMVLQSEWREATTLGNKAEFPSPWSRKWLLQNPSGPVQYVLVDAQWTIHSGEVQLGAALLQFQVVFLSKPGCTYGTLSDGVDLVIFDSPTRVRCVELSDTSDRRILLVAQNKDQQAPMIRSLLLSEAIPQSLILLLALALVWYGIAYVGRPMSGLRDQMMSRGADNLNPIDNTNTPPELAPLIEGINALMVRLQASLAAQRRFISDAAHQLRTPLAALRAQAELLIGAADGVQREQALQRLLDTTQRSIRLSTQLLSLARAESVGTTGEASQFDFRKMCEAVVADVAPMAIAKDIDFSLEADSGEFSVRGDEMLLGELIRNLLDNAFKYTPPNGSIMLSIRPASRELIVDDSGPGIAPADREAVFAPFTRRPVIDPASGLSISGSGLGLAIVREVARAHRAKIEVSDSPLGGARLILKFL